jgi:hypothetical protein
MVGFQVAGALTNLYQSTIPAARVGNSSQWSGTVSTANLLGTYSATPVIVPNGGGAQTACGNAVAFFQVAAAAYPDAPGPVSCTSMTGTWSDSIPGQQNPFTWGGIVDTGGTISNGTLMGSYCGTSVTWNTITGKYSSANESYSLTASNPSPAFFSCADTIYKVDPLSSNGNLQGASCGLGKGMASDTNGQAADTLTTERIPGGETSSAGGGPSFATSYGYATTAIFNMALTSPSGSNYNFGGRTVQELPPSQTDTIPPGYVGTDGCWWNGAPWRAPITSLAARDTWSVQSSGQNGSYGPDYVGINPAYVAYAQRNSPRLQSPGSSCTIQYPQKMVINQESVAQTAPPATEPYGSPGFGLNLIQMVISPTTILIGRGNASVGQGFHF